MKSKSLTTIEKFDQCVREIYLLTKDNYVNTLFQVEEGFYFLNRNFQFKYIYRDKTLS